MIKASAGGGGKGLRIAYDDDVLYVGARMVSHDGRIQAPLGRRDSTDQVEHILIAFDTFLDHRTAVVFGVTAAATASRSNACAALSGVVTSLPPMSRV